MWLLLAGLAGAAIVCYWVVASPTLPAADGWSWQVPPIVSAWWITNRRWIVLPLFVFCSLPMLVPRFNAVLASALAVAGALATFRTRNWIYLTVAAMNMALALAFLDAWRGWFIERWQAAERFVGAAGRSPASRHTPAAVSTSHVRGRPVLASERPPVPIEFSQRALAVERFGLDLPVEVLPPFDGEDWERAARGLRGCSVFLDDSGLASHVALQRLRESLAGVGVSVKGSDVRADAYVVLRCIGGNGRFAFAVTLPFRPGSGCATECAAEHLPHTVIRALAHAFRRVALTASDGARGTLAG